MTLRSGMKVSRLLSAASIFVVVAATSLAQHAYAQQSLDTVLSEVAGFRSDMWYLADESLLGFVEIPAGTFPMGSNPLIDPMAFENERWSESRRQGIVDLPTYYISRHEVTVAQFKAFADATGYRADPLALQGPLNHPVANVSWTDALAYARWLDARLRESEQTPEPLKQLLADGWRVTIPDEAQWEKAARGSEGRIYPWGNQPSRDKANYSGTSTTPVGSHACPECQYGLHDMSGNVWEWTRSPYQPLPFDPSDDRTNLAEDALWVMRGGSFNDAENNARAAVRGAADPGARRPFIGFRLVITRL